MTLYQFFKPCEVQRYFFCLPLCGWAGLHILCVRVCLLLFLSLFAPIKEARPTNALPCVLPYHFPEGKLSCVCACLSASCVVTCPSWFAAYRERHRWPQIMPFLGRMGPPSTFFCAGPSSDGTQLGSKV